MPKTPFILAAAAALLAALFLLPIRIRVLAATAPRGAELRFGVSLRRKPARPSRALRFVLFGGRLRTFLITKEGVTLLKKRKKRLPARSALSLARALNVKALSVCGRVGIPGDPAAGALLAGALGGLVDSAERIAFALLPCGCPSERSVRILPDFAENAFSLRAEGISETDLRKLIMSLIKAYLVKER